MSLKRTLLLAIPTFAVALLAACPAADRADPEAAAPLPVDTSHAVPPHTEPPAIPPHTAPHPPPGDLPDAEPRDTPTLQGAR